VERAEVNLVRRVARRTTPTQKARQEVGVPPEDATIIRGNAALIDEESGRVVAVQSVVAPQLANRLAQQLHRVKWQGAKNKKGNASNEARLSGIVASHSTFGYAFPNPLRRRYACCSTAFNRTYPDAAATLDEAAQVAHRLFRATAKDVYEETTRHVYERIAPVWRLGGTPWTSGIINNNAALPYHRDAGNIPGSWSAMLTCREHCEGGYLHLADYDLWLELPNGSVSIFDGQSVLHGVSPFRLTKPHGHRYTSVFYSPSRMAKCAPTHEEEALYAQRRATEAEERRQRKESPA